jgi:hypothetical protein
MNQKINADLIHHCRIEDCGPLKVPDPEYGDLRLAVFPFFHDGEAPLDLPDGFKRWEPTVREIMRQVPVQSSATQCFVTIDSKFFSTPGYLRREGVHMDGNFCADPTFAGASWGGSGDNTTWGGLRFRQGAPSVEMADNSHVEMGFKIPYKLTIPIGRYVSSTLGGTLVASSYEGCQAWPGTYYGKVGAGGDWSAMLDQRGAPVKVTAHRLWFLTSNCPHETTLIPAGIRRTFIRVTLPHNYDNDQLLSALAGEKP